MYIFVSGILLAAIFQALVQHPFNLTVYASEFISSPLFNVLQCLCPYSQHKCLFPCHVDQYVNVPVLTTGST